MSPFHPPIDLSSLPGYRPAARTAPLRTAFIGRCSTKDNQDPRSSISGQVAEATALLEPGQEWVAYFWDVESGMLGLDERSQISDEVYASLGVTVPRDGGVNEMLAAAERGEFDRVVCERISRVARDTLASLLVEKKLERLGVALECANEPRGGMTSGRLGSRRYQQVNAEIARYELMEMSMRGQRDHAAAGYRHGKACYGYIAVVDHSAPPPNRFGVARPKMRLALDPDQRRVDTVAKVFDLRRTQRLPDPDIGRLLRADLDQHPLDPGQRPWTAQRVHLMLAQPKYSGYQVYNRRASRTGRYRRNPIQDWIWSREQAHPAIVDLEDWYETQLVTAELNARRTPGWARVHAAAAECRLPITKVSQNSTHTLYEVAGQQIIVPAGDLPPAVADEVIALMTRLAS